MFLQIAMFIKNVKQEIYNNRHFHVILTPEFFDAKFITCITVCDNREEGSMQALKFGHRILILLLMLL
jgi:hypothetical protein